MIKRTSLFACLMFVAHGIALAENFDNISALPGAGWALVNNSSPLGTTGWFQGNSGVFAAKAGPIDSYIAANCLNAALGGNISNWLLTPEVSLFDGSIRFYTRSNGGVCRPAGVEAQHQRRQHERRGDRYLGRRLQHLAAHHQPRASPRLPDAWTRFTATVSGLGAGDTGRYAFRYFVTDTNNQRRLHRYRLGVDQCSPGTGIHPQPCHGNRRAGSSSKSGIKEVTMIRNRIICHRGRPRSISRGRSDVRRGLGRRQQEPGKPAATAAKQSLLRPVSSQGVRVFIDPATGKIREPEPEEIQQLAPAARR